MDDEVWFDRSDMNDFGDYCQTLGYWQGYQRRADECQREHRRDACPAGVVGCDGWLLCADLRRN